jgi:CheY-like chemotaxis protein
MAFDPEARLKNIALTMHIDSDIPDVLKGDELRIKQVLVNLLSNSLKFTESGSIELSVNLLENEEHHSVLQFGVRDTGIGIPYDKQDEIFSSFAQVESGSKRKYGGTGLGLAISKKLINLMGGTINVESTPGQGSFFNIELALSHSDHSGKTSGFSMDITIPEGRKILLVEDNAVNTMVATKMLQKTNQEVYTASNGKEALEQVKKNTYDLILMDIQMPIMDGLEATRKIRQSKGQSASTPIVALTAGAMQQDREKAMKEGMNDFIAKPINYDQLEKVLIKYLNNPEEVPSMLK